MIRRDRAPRTAGSCRGTLDRQRSRPASARAAARSRARAPRGSGSRAGRDPRTSRPARRSGDRAVRLELFDLEAHRRETREIDVRMRGRASRDLGQMRYYRGMITVHHLNNSRSQRVLWALEELGVPYEIKRYERDRQTMLAPPRAARGPSARQVAGDRRRRTRRWRSRARSSNTWSTTYGKGALQPAANDGTARRDCNTATGCTTPRARPMPPLLHEAGVRSHEDGDRCRSSSSRSRSRSPSKVEGAAS